MKTSFQRLSILGFLFGLFQLLPGCGGEHQFAEGMGLTQKLTPEQQADLEATVERNFLAGEILQQDLNLNTEFGLIGQNLVLQQNPPTEETKYQIDRPKNQKHFVQGHDGTNNTDKFSVKELGILDILVVMDNSNSMQPMQDKLKTRLAALIGNVQNTNWQIGVVTTDNPCLRRTAEGKRTVTRDDFNKDANKAQADFEYLVNAGTKGSTIERGIQMATDALIGDCGDANNDWKRPDSLRSVLLVTDEKNCGSATNDGCAGKPWESADYFLNNAPKNTRVYGLFLLTEPDSTNAAFCPDSGGYDGDPKPQSYLDLVNATGGIAGEICQEDYSQVLESISANVSERVLQKFDLSYPPENEQVQEVKVDNQVWAPNKYRVEGQSLILVEKLGPAAAALEVTYKHGAAARKDEYPVTGNPDMETFLVLINDIPVPSSEYVYDQQAQIIRFKNMPPDKARIDIVFRDNQPLTREFPITGNYVPDTLQVFIDGKATTDYVLGADGKTISFNKAPADAAQIKLSYAQPGDKKTEYDVAGDIDVSRIEEVTIEDKATKSPVIFTRDGSKITFPESEINTGREVMVYYNLKFTEDQLNFNVPLPSLPLPDSVTVNADGNAEVCSQDVALENQDLQFRCMNDNVFQILVQYKYVHGYTNQFEMPGAFNDRKEWQVFVNDQVYENYTREGNRITIPEADLSAGSRVKIIVRPKPSQPEPTPSQS